jgi:hypothetical protein
LGFADISQHKYTSNDPNTPMTPSCQARLAIAMSIGDTAMNISADNVIHGLKNRKPSSASINNPIRLKTADI